MCDLEGFTSSPLINTNKMDDLFKRTMTDIEMYSKVLKSLAERSIELGLAPKDVTVQRAHLKVDGAINRLMKCEETAKELGYDSLPNALKALKMITEKSGIIDLGQLPEVFHKVPKIWRIGRPPTRRTEGFAPMKLSAAQREHRQIIPLLLEAWNLANDEAKDTMITDYLRTSAENFKQELYDFIHDNEETSLEDELIDTISKQVEQERFEDWSDRNAFERSRRQKKK